MELEENLIKEIASQLEIGLVSFLNLKTGIPIFVPDENDPDAYDSMEFYQEDLKKINSNQNDYIKIKKMPSGNAFRVMKKFTEGVENRIIQEKLFQALNKSKPFRNFRNVIDYNHNVREDWFKFKTQKYIEWVKQNIEYLNKQ